jgi:hypothetical protein
MSKKLRLPKNDKLMHKREVDDSWFGEVKQRESPIPSNNDRFVNCRYRIPVKQKLSFISLCRLLLQMSNISVLLWSLPAPPTSKNKSSSWRGGRNIMGLITVLKKGAKWPSHQREGPRIWCSFASPSLDGQKSGFQEGLHLRLHLRNQKQWGIIECKLLLSTTCIGHPCWLPDSITISLPECCL